ncbi:hypothetical protein [Streptomyces sp. NPDC054901]
MSAPVERAREALRSGAKEYATLVRLPVRARGDPVRYWATLGTAGELLAAWLPPGDPEVARRVREARERCAREAAATAR